MSEQVTNSELHEEIQNLNALVEAFSLLNSSIDLETVLLNTLSKATELMNADISSIALLNDEKTHLVFLESTDPNFDKLKNLQVPIGQGIAGNVALTGVTVRVDDVKNDPRFYGKIDQAMNQRTMSYLCVPLIADNAIIGTAQIMNKKDGTSFTERDEKLMVGFSKQAALAISNAKLHGIMLKQKAIDSELKVCREIQQKLYPAKTPQLEGYELYGSSIPSREVGGDYFAFITRVDESMDVVVADVSGKGISAAMMVSELHSGLQILSMQSLQLDTMGRILNDHLVDSLILGKFITLFAGRLRPDYSLIEYIVAGHPPPFIISRDGNVRQLEMTGKVLGLMKGGLTKSKIHI
ncbi:MAG: SpoIIE family protein phosphatase, partial [Leptospiraceae bacterium]|nr:SpoIIE family protein phosphatase [Leptospiraceae bacterium]